MNKQTFLANYLYFYAKHCPLIKDFYSDLLKDEWIDLQLVAKIEKDHLLFQLEKSPEAFAYYANAMLSSTDKKKGGVEYTPIPIAQNMARYLLYKNKQRKALKEVTIFDPAVGSGILLVSLAREIIEKENVNAKDFIENQIFGIDVDSFQVLLTNISLSLLSFEKTGTFPQKINLVCQDAFNLSKALLQKYFSISQFDLIISNPPYISSRNLSLVSKQLIKKNFSKVISGVMDAYIPFFQITNEYLSSEGSAILITPNSYLLSNYCGALRSFLLKECREINLINFGNLKLFKNIMSYSAITYFSKSNEKDRKLDKIQVLALDKNNIFTPFEKLNSFDIFPKEYWRTLSPQDAFIINVVENRFSTTLGNLDFKAGISTQRDNIYSFSFDKEDEHYYFFKKDNIQYKVEKEITKHFILPNLTNMPKNKRIIFPYFFDSTTQKMKAYTEVVFQEKFPFAYEYLSFYREELGLRSTDKNISSWFSYGRSQGINLSGNRLYLPKIAKKVFSTFSTGDDELFGIGYAIFHPSKEYLLFLQTILQSDLFSHYLQSVSLPYSGGYFSTAKNQIKNFSIPSFSKFEEIKRNWKGDVFALYELT